MLTQIGWKKFPIGQNGCGPVSGFRPVHRAVGLSPPSPDLPASPPSPSKTPLHLPGSYFRYAVRLATNRDIAFVPGHGWIDSAAARQAARRCALATRRRSQSGEGFQCAGAGAGHQLGAFVGGVSSARSKPHPGHAGLDLEAADPLFCPPVGTLGSGTSSDVQTPHSA